MTLRTTILAALTVAMVGFGVSSALAVNAGTPGTYRDPKSRFVIAVPPDAQVSEKSGEDKVAIESRKGYRITLQMGPSKPAVSLPDMARKLEPLHLGPSKVWSAKLGEHETSIGALPALESIYEGSGTRVRLFIMRGRQTDFVFMFFAPPRIFDNMTPIFDWVLQNFQLASEELPNDPSAVSQVAPKPVAVQASAPLVSASPTGDLVTPSTIPATGWWKSPLPSPPCSAVGRGARPITPRSASKTSNRERRAARGRRWSAFSAISRPSWPPARENCPTLPKAPLLMIAKACALRDINFWSPTSTRVTGSANGPCSCRVHRER